MRKITRRKRKIALLHNLSDKVGGRRKGLITEMIKDYESIQKENPNGKTNDQRAVT